ncbi:type II toxin-antitoxin system VapC family toxin [Salinarimonas ramus]|uniref:Twitching motility protein PilT n=1 Tax=Salinarimonas ramus TaxID=690164 RepID=A0A917Q5U8_9HYPH|nr:type II toxin-antitoxin system VapC family toxin [Salinarimonas ramus]GGK29241.1 twitching motility protein PilT [Salinarimonas ramus]
MRVLCDTHVLLWAAYRPEMLSTAERSILTDAANLLVFSVASLWEVAIKGRLRSDFDFDASELRAGLLANGYEELPIIAAHVLAVAGLPAIHRDPFDRLLVAQAIAEDLAFLTRDAVLARYSAVVRLV